MSRLGIEPELSLAFSVHSGPGTYAILLGSGVSRAAGVPTGWEVTLDLVHRGGSLPPFILGPMSRKPSQTTTEGI
jgi:hypothetical protein